jgi:hypothetical protein
MIHAQTANGALLLPQMLRRQEGPFRELDLLAIGSVLVVVMAILGIRRLVRKRRKDSFD